MQLPGELFNPRLKENKKIPSKKSSYILLHFEKWNFLALIFKKFLYFLMFWEAEIP